MKHSRTQIENTITIGAVTFWFCGYQNPYVDVHTKITETTFFAINSMTLKHPTTYTSLIMLVYEIHAPENHFPVKRSKIGRVFFPVVHLQYNIVVLSQNKL